MWEQRVKKNTSEETTSSVLAAKRADTAFLLCRSLIIIKLNEISWGNKGVSD